MDLASVSRCPEWSNPVRGVVYGILGTASVQSVMAGIFHRRFHRTHAAGSWLSARSGMVI